MQIKNVRESGFTLIEMAIVLIIIAVLMSAALQGQQFINSAKEKQLESDFSNIPMMIYGYQSKYKSIPGDDKNAVDRFSSLDPSVKNGDGEGLILGKWFEFDTSADSALIWQHLRLGGFMQGESNLLSPSYIPHNIVGGALDIQSGANQENSPIIDLAGHGVAGNYTLCSKGIPGELAMSLDIHLDDGNPGMGNMLIAPDTDGAITARPAATIGTNTASDIANEKSYIVCMGF